MLALGTFNNYYSLKKYCDYIDKTYQNFFLFYVEHLTNSNGNTSNYNESMKVQFNEYLENYIYIDNILYHKKLIVCDKDDNLIEYDQLSTEIKNEIAQYIYFQKKSLINFINKHIGGAGKKNTLTKLRWISLITELIELGNVLYEGRFVSAENGPITKKEFMKIFLQMFNVNLDSWEITLNKAMSRENPAKFIDKLKSTVLKYNDSLINK